MNIFEEQQEINLDRIQKQQENEQILELRKQQQKKMEEEIGNEISSQEALFHEIKGNIDVAQMVLAELKRENRTLASQDGPGGGSNVKKHHGGKD